MALAARRAANGGAGGDGRGGAGLEFCYFVIHAMTWTMANLAARTCRPSGANASGVRRGIREGFESGIPAERLAEAAGLFVPRVDQIRDGR